jgi:hypothetical protein
MPIRALSYLIGTGVGSVAIFSPSSSRATNRSPRPSWKSSTLVYAHLDETRFAGTWTH